MKKFFQQQHYYALAKDLRELKDGNSIPSCLADYERVEEKLCVRFVKDSIDFDPAEWHKRSSVDGEGLRYTRCEAS